MAALSRWLTSVSSSLYLKSVGVDGNACLPGLHGEGLGGVAGLRAAGQGQGADEGQAGHEWPSWRLPVPGRAAVRVGWQGRIPTGAGGAARCGIPDG
jgi:hypothetical protein